MVLRESNCAHPPSVVARFWPKVDRRGDDECWVWTASLRGQMGYGQFVEVSGPPRRTVSAHRVAWEIYNGPIPAGAFVLHRCDNPPCCNPAHLFLGTHADNMADMAAKGRKYTGGGPKGRGKFTPELKTKARALHAAGHSQVKIADEVGVHQSVVSRFLTGRRP